MLLQKKSLHANKHLLFDSIKSDYEKKFIELTQNSNSYQYFILSFRSIAKNSICF